MALLPEVQLIRNTQLLFTAETGHSAQWPSHVGLDLDMGCCGHRVHVLPMTNTERKAKQGPCTNGAHLSFAQWSGVWFVHQNECTHARSGPSTHRADGILKLYDVRLQKHLSLGITLVQVNKKPVCLVGTSHLRQTCACEAGYVYGNVGSETSTISGACLSSILLERKGYEA